VTSKKPLIAILDDDESVCRAMERLVRSLGMAAETYVSSQDFMEQMESLPDFHLDCVILDVQMPGMDGLEVQRRLRWIFKDIPVIFITAHDDRAARDRALAEGAIAVLRKPCTDILLMRTLEAALASRRAKEPPPGPDAPAGPLAQGPIVPPGPE
jgi:FixJ family two-component response regulator